MEDRTGVRRRLDLHNISIDFAFHACRTMRFHPLDIGLVCWLPHRHHGP